MFEQEDLVWAMIDGKPTQMSVVDPCREDGMCECYICGEGGYLLIPTEELYSGSIPDEPQYFPRKRKRRAARDADCSTGDPFDA